MIYGPDARSVEAPINFRIQLPWFGYSGYKLVVAGLAAVLLLATWYGITRTRLGLVMRATQFDSETAQAFGIPVDRVYAAVFALGAMLAAIAGVLIVPIKQAHYLMGLDPLLLSFIVVIIGGLGSLRGTVIAALRHRHQRRRDLGLLLAHPGEDHRHPARRAGAGVPAGRPVRRKGARMEPRTARSRCMAASSRCCSCCSSCCRPITTPTSPASWCWPAMPSATISCSAIPAC